MQPPPKKTQAIIVEILETELCLPSYKVIKISHFDYLSQELRKIKWLEKNCSQFQVFKYTNLSILLLNGSQKFTLYYISQKEQCFVKQVNQCPSWWKAHF